MACDSPFYVLPKAGTEKVPVPCGRCPPCKKRRVDGWVFRLMQEDKIATASHFVTLTYTTDAVPISNNGFMTLKKSDFQDFMKRLRKLCPGCNLKYYAAGEYGSQRKRPHYHAIIFNVPDTELFAKAWTLGGVQLGSVWVDKVTGDSVAYTMKYIDKAGYEKKFARDDRLPEFALMSKGLGKNYLSPAIVSYHKNNIDLLCLTKPGGVRIAMPKYYRDKLFDESMKKRQMRIVQNAISAEERMNRILHQVEFGDSVTFEARQDDARIARNKRFYHISKQNRSHD